MLRSLSAIPAEAGIQDACIAKVDPREACPRGNGEQGLSGIMAREGVRGLGLGTHLGEAEALTILIRALARGITKQTPVGNAGQKDAKKGDHEQRR